MSLLFAWLVIFWSVSADRPQAPIDFSNSLGVIVLIVIILLIIALMRGH